MDDKIAALDAQIEPVRAEIQKLNQRLMLLIGKRDKLVEQRDSKLVENMAEPDWPWLLFEDGRAGTARHKAFHEKIQTLGLRGSMGYLPDINQRVVQVRFGEGGESVETQLEGLETLLPHLKSHPKFHGVYIDLMEPTLSEHGIYFLTYTPEKTSLKKTTYGSTQTLREFRTLREALEHCAKMHAFRKEDY